MSKKGNPAVIGGFVLVAIILAVIAVAFLGSIKFNSEEEDFVMFFAESVTGLDAGSKVRFQGITIGKVYDVRIRHTSKGNNGVPFDNQKDTKLVYDSNGNQYNKDIALIPIYVRIDMARLREMGIMEEKSLTAEGVQAIAQDLGLRAQLQVENMISGVKFIELNFFTSSQLKNKYEADTRGHPFFGQRFAKMPELPTVPSFQKSAEQLFDSFSKIDVEQIQDTLLATMTSLQNATNSAQKKLEGVDMKELSTNLSQGLASFDKAAKALEGRIADPEIDATIADVRKTLDTYNKLAKDVNAKIDPVLVELAQTNKDAQSALKSIERVGDRVDGALAPEASLRYELQSAMSGIANASASIARLVEYLERHPNALITGRSPTNLPQ